MAADVLRDLKFSSLDVKTFRVQDKSTQEQVRRIIGPLATPDRIRVVTGAVRFLRMLSISPSWSSIP